MNTSPSPFPCPDRPIDALVRSRLEADASGIDGRSLLAGALGRRDRTREGWGRMLVGLPAALAAGLLGLLLLTPSKTAHAGPAQVVGQAEAAHAAPIDRSYRLRTEASGAFGKRASRWALEREATLWTRGDRFRIEPGPGGRGTWGRDERGHVWLAPTRRAGASFAPEEVPPLLEDLLALRSVDLPALLGTALRDCDLRRLPWRPGDPLATERIEAVPRDGGGRGGLIRAVLDIDPRDGVVRHLALTRRLPGGAFTLRLDLLATEVQPADTYRLGGHLAPGARVIDSGRPGARAAFLLHEWFGPAREKAP